MTTILNPRVLSACLLACCLTISAGRALAADAGDGKQLYMRYCSACHGESGKGDGVVSQSMRPHPTDLTQLAKLHGGSFPMADVAGQIDGRETLRAHGDADMPVWGEKLRQTGGSLKAPNETATNRVLLITNYLQSIQAK